MRRIDQGVWGISHTLPLGHLRGEGESNEVGAALNSLRMSGFVKGACDMTPIIFE